MKKIDEYVNEDGDQVDVFEVKETDEEPRNASERVSASSRSRGGSRSRGDSRSRSRRRYEHHVRRPSSGGLVPAGSAYLAQPVAVPTQPAPVAVDGDSIRLSKAALIDWVPAGAKILAAMRKRPAAPQITGDPKLDAENAAAHRDALKAHEDQQRQIEAFGEGFGKALKLVVGG